MKYRKAITILPIMLAVILLAGCGQTKDTVSVQPEQPAQVTQANAQAGQAEQVAQVAQVSQQDDQAAKAAQADLAAKQSAKNYVPQSQRGVYAAYIGDEYMVGAITWQLSAEAQALMEQAYAAATLQVLRMMDRCLDPEDPDWEYDAEANAMYYQGVRVAIVTDIDDTLVQTAGYFCDVVANYGDYSNTAFSRFLMSDACIACPGAVDFINTCVDNGIEVFYITNRSDQGYLIGRSDSQGSYQEAVGGGKGLYVDNDGVEIGASIYQCLGKSVYDITLESMTRLGFPIDDQHLIVNDSSLKGSSKESARQAIIQGDEAYPNGQREGENVSGSSLTASIEPHYIAMLLGDNLGDFTDDFYADGLDAVSRAELASDYADEFGTKWIVLPNSIYGASYSYAQAYGMTELMEYYSYR